MKNSINLGDPNKFVPYKTNGITNCLDLCKMILNNYGLTYYGSSAHVFKLMYEKDGKLIHYGDNVKENYNNAINCIDRHLENNRPIIVGVNHTIGKTINEGTTDHFVVIYGRGFDKSKNSYYYNYYEVGKSNIVDGYDDVSNRFYYTLDPLALCDTISKRGDKVRFDVTQVRPNDGNINNTVTQNG